MPHPTTVPLTLFLLTALFTSATPTKFDLGSVPISTLRLLGDAHLKNGSIRLTRDQPVPNSFAGRALYATPVRIRNPEPVPFTTFFSFTITNLNPSSIGGGLAFLITSDDKFLGDAGGFIGLTSTNSTTPPTIAVEFDTLMDVEFDDINGNHVGVDLGTLVSAQVCDLDSADIDLKSGDFINTWIDYADGFLEVSVSYAAVRPAKPLFSFPVDIGEFLDNDLVYVGFSGSTQGSTEIHSIEAWSFSSSSASVTPPSTNSTSPGPAAPTLPESNQSTSPLDSAPSTSFWTDAERYTC